MMALLPFVGAVAAAGLSVAGAAAAVAAWIDNATEGPDGPLTETDYRAMLPRCSYQTCGAESAGRVADFELCPEHLGALLPTSHTPSWV